MAELFEEGKIAPEYCDEALRREIRWSNTFNDEILKAESIRDARNTDFPRLQSCARS
jgi:hypothetical protein